MTRKLFPLMLLGSTAYGQPRVAAPRAAIGAMNGDLDGQRISAGGGTARETPRPPPSSEVVARVFAARVRADEVVPPAADPTLLPWVDPPKRVSDEEALLHPKKRRVMIAPMSSPTGGKGVKLKIRF